MSNSSYYFDEFFAAGGQESISPFLTPKSKRWSRHLSLKSALLSSVLLLVSYITSFYHADTSLLFLIGVYFLSGTPALIDSLEDLFSLEINIELLMTLAALFSVVVGSAMEGGLLLVLFKLSAAMEKAVTHKTNGAILKLNKLVPRVANVLIEEGTILERAVRDITVGTTIFVRSGEIIPLDGTVVKGSAFVNLVHLTGESHPVAVKMGDPVVAGALNLDGSLTIQVSKTSENSTLSRLIDLIIKAGDAKPKLERLLDRFGKGYALTIIFLSLLFSLALPLFFSMPFLGSKGSIYRALAFLIAASPCALIIATPTAYLSAITCCAKRGILLKGGVTLDALAKCKTIAFDKTGTLTTGKLQCVFFTKWYEKSSLTLKEALGIAASLEQGALHPVAEAIVSYANQEACPSFEIKEFKATAGGGVEGVVSFQGKQWKACLGNVEFVESRIPDALKKDWDDKKEERQKEGHLCSHLLIGEELFTFHFKDELRTFSSSVIAKLKKMKWRILMLTGDKNQGADEIAKSCGISEVFSNLRPEEKLAKVEELAKEEDLVMVGDGINDAPALARATVGISMGAIGSKAAVEASDIVFLKDDLAHLDWLICKANSTLSIVKQNLILAASVILFATIPALLGIIPLWLAVILHEGGTVLVGLNSLRLLRS